MASIRQAAQDVLSEARDGIAWIALWKDGKGWMATCFWPDYDERTNRFTFEDYDQEELNNILKLDPEAVIVNSYYDNLGDTTCMTRDSLAAMLRWHYDTDSFRLKDALN